jgi:tryptophanyl-tRNA synthetase
MSRRRVLTGIKPTGRPHIGNYLGAIRPALALADQSEEAVFFAANLHALTTLKDGDKLRQLTHEMTASWIALGLDTDRHIFFRQSDLPEIPTLTWILACFSSKGLLDRAHAYKAALDRGDRVNVGLYTYPVLMAADIIGFGATDVPVGVDQKQHVEIARDVAQAVNHELGKDVVVVPQPVIMENVARVPGIDGRKMSKSYDNDIPIFDTPKRIKKRVFAIVTDSTPREAPKDPATCNIFAIYRLLATPEQTEALAAQYRAGGFGWGDAKQALYELLLDTFGHKRERFDALMADPSRIEQELAKGAERARPIIGTLVAELRACLGV